MGQLAGHQDAAPVLQAFSPDMESQVVYFLV